ncbi:class I SAM-dependent methyltransferase [Mycolicibacterium chlorophenolicum]|uniref:Ubiquinone biosynthesis O-methyltransferase n=1 Tax=Mycolicibacterium chlorophenolicum TaxID=37916 RepID=A0A0J6W0Y7_9MYCO|nr:methyltransferase [Mycolicibacterium chlorophenolicum]KMO75347.1 Ubiquinone biosynthesis O-methyltransferase [Mycolicibacterium chlorophenolicum]
MIEAMGDDTWEQLAGPFADETYASLKGRVRSQVLHHQLLDHLPGPPGSVLDVGGGAGHQSFPLAHAGFEVTLLDPSPAMLAKAGERWERLPLDVQRRVRLIQADGEQAVDAVEGRRFDAVLCHGVLMYLETPDALVDQLCTCTADGGVVSIMALNAATMAVRPALERRWTDALAAFDATEEVGVLGVPTRADTVEDLSALLRAGGVDPTRWYGVWLFTDWLEFAGAVPRDGADESVEAIVRVELEAAARDPYRQLSRVFHLVGRKRPC